MGRACFWRDPGLYRWVGRLRGRGDCQNLDYDMWIDGFPGSAGALTAKGFQEANPDSRIAAPRHLPPFILNALYHFKPGMFLMGQPADVVVSWAIVANRSLAECLDYYNDFHRLLAPNAPWLFVVTIEELINQPQTVMEAFNLHFRTNFTAPDRHLAARISSLEQSHGRQPASSGELKLSKPVPGRTSIRQELRQRLRKSPSLAKKLDYARELHSIFVPGARCHPSPPLNFTTRHLPSLS